MKRPNIQSKSLIECCHVLESTVAAAPALHTWKQISHQYGPLRLVPAKSMVWHA